MKKKIQFQHQLTEEELLIEKALKENKWLRKTSTLSKEVVYYKPYKKNELEDGYVNYLSRYRISIGDEDLHTSSSKNNYILPVGYSEYKYSIISEKSFKVLFNKLFTFKNLFSEDIKSKIEKAIVEKQWIKRTDNIFGATYYYPCSIKGDSLYFTITIDINGVLNTPNDSHVFITIHDDDNIEVVNEKEVENFYNERFSNFKTLFKKDKIVKSITNKNKL